MPPAAGARREEEVVGEAVHAAGVLHEVGRHPAIVVANTSPVLLVPLSTPQRRVALLQLVAGTNPRLVPGVFS